MARPPPEVLVAISNKEMGGGNHYCITPLAATLLLQLRGSRKPLESRGLREPAQASSAGTDLGAGTEARHQPPGSASERPATPDDYSTNPPPRPHQTPRPHIKPKKGLPSPFWAN
ncbi:hypothetical protein PCANC_19246 [Puccinia coronata f. sp. avenae]|uniref:Uncharacterized protein n=1 Tax=Puccinia coronata f. sp. avenae TaxID=200324 RepID=A0A2N5UFH3_9BASI|nr:hypothetical protein PCANC_19246 [Puccinia coronata f. sp. avenae]